MWDTRTQHTATPTGEIGNQQNTRGPTVQRSPLTTYTYTYNYTDTNTDTFIPPRNK